MLFPFVFILLQVLHFECFGFSTCVTLKPRRKTVLIYVTIAVFSLAEWWVGGFAFSFCVVLVFSNLMLPLSASYVHVFHDPMANGVARAYSTAFYVQIR